MLLHSVLVIQVVLLQIYKQWKHFNTETNLALKVTYEQHNHYPSLQKLSEPDDEHVMALGHVSVACL